MLKIKNKIEFEDNCWIGLLDNSDFNKDQKHRIKAVTDIASITKGRLGFKEEKLKDIYDNSVVKGNAGIYPLISPKRQNLYNRLLIESAGKPSVPFEFIPVIHSQDFFDKDVFNNILKYSYMTQYSNQSILLSNYRMILSQTKDWNFNYLNSYNIDKNINYKDFKIIVGQIPIKVLSHLRTHRAFSFLVESSRNKRYLNEVKFWYPSWWDKEIYSELIKKDNNIISQAKWLIQYTNLKPEEATMELSDRRLVHFAMAAWLQDKNAWDNLFAVRASNQGTMNITAITVNNIKKLIYEK